MVLSQKHTFSCKIIVHLCLFFLCLLLILFAQCLGKCRYKGGFEHRFADQQINTCQFRLMLNGTPVICRHYDDRHLRSHNAADTPGCLDTIHLRHFPVNQYHIKIFSVIPQIPDPVHRFKPAVTMALSHTATSSSTTSVLRLAKL